MPELFPVLLSLAIACGPKDGGGGSDSSGGDGGVPLAEGDIAIEGLSAAALDDVATVLRVEWTTDPAASCWVEYGEDESFALQTPADETGTAHEHLLLGMPADSEVSYRLQCEADGSEPTTSILLDDSTGSLPSTIPSLTVEGAGQQGYLLTTLIGQVTAAVIIDEQGRVTWYHVVDFEDGSVFRAAFTPDRQSIVYGHQGEVLGHLAQVGLDGQVKWSLDDVPYSHDLTVLPDGTIAAIFAEFREVDGVGALGDVITEIAPDGVQTQVWSAFDHFDPTTTGFAGGTDTAWTLANAIDYDPEDDAYLLSMRNMSTIVRISRATGEHVWALGSDGATMGFAEGSTPFAHQHQSQMLSDDRIVVFDNGDLERDFSAIREYSMDLGAGLATEEWSYVADPSLYAYILGDVHRYEDGDTLAVWCTAGQIERVDPEGQVEWTLNAELGTAFGFVTPLDSLYVE